jgi:hypothetical protein
VVETDATIAAVNDLTTECHVATLPHAFAKECHIPFYFRRYDVNKGRGRKHPADGITALGNSPERIWPPRLSSCHPTLLLSIPPCRRPVVVHHQPSRCSTRSTTASCAEDGPPIKNTASDNMRSAFRGTQRSVTLVSRSSVPPSSSSGAKHCVCVPSHQGERCSLLALEQEHILALKSPLEVRKTTQLSPQPGKHATHPLRQAPSEAFKKRDRSKPGSTLPLTVLCRLLF